MCHRIAPCRAHDTAILPEDVEDDIVSPFDTEDEAAEAPDDPQIGYPPGESPYDDLDWDKAA